MATEQQLIEGLKRADAAGDTQAARAFAQALGKLRSTPKQPQENISDEEREIRGKTEWTRKARQGPGSSLQAFTDKAVHEMTLHADDVVLPALSALPNAAVSALKGKGFDPAREYRVEREVRKRSRQNNAEDHGTAQTLGNVGMLLSPVGAETGAARIASKIAPEFMAKVGASKVGRAASTLGNSSVGLGARAGANNAAVMAAMDGENIGDAALMGGAFGGALGGAFGAGGAMYRAIHDRAPENAGRIAYEKAGEMLGRTRKETYAPDGYRPGAKPYSAEGLEREMQLARGRGHEPMVADYSPEMQTQLAALARKPRLAAANEAKSQAGARTEGAIDRFRAEVQGKLTPDTGTNAFTLKEQLQANRKAQGAADYAKGGAMDEPMQWSKELDDFFAAAPPQTEKALRNAYEEMLLRREKPTMTVEGRFTDAPNLRTLDYVKRGFDKEIGAAIKAGDNATAQGLHQELREIKRMLGEANPQYREILDRQRDLFQQQEAVRLGEEALQRLKKDPREYLAELKKLPANTYEDLQTGMADALLQMRKNGNPVGFMRRVMRLDEQRAVMEHIFGSRKKLVQFERWLRREAKAGATDKAVNTGSPTMPLMAAANDTEGAAAEMVGSNTLRGFGFGGVTGAGANMWRSYDLLRRGMGVDAQNELARILSGDGTGLAKGIQSAKDYATKRETSRSRRAVMAGKIGALLSQGG